MAERILVVGESLVDVVRAADGSTVDHPGGSPANVAVALARLGAPVELVTAFGRDRRGDLLADHFAAEGVVLAGDPRLLERTSTAQATIDSEGAASYEFDLGGALPEPPPSADRVHVHTGSIGAVLAPGGDVVVRAIEAHAGQATVSYDVNARPAVTGAGPDLVARVERVAALADLVKASDEDLAVVYPELPLEQAAARLLALGAAAVVVTRGAAGAVCFGSVAAVAVPAVTVGVVDTIGAGDAFCAGLLDGLRHAGYLGGANRAALHTAPGSLWREVTERAVAAAAITVSRPGAYSPTATELPSPSVHPAR